MPLAPPYATLTVLGGALKGTQLVIDDAVDDVLIGSDPDSRLFLDAPGVSPIHARLWLDTAGATLHDTRSPAGVWVNDDRVTDPHPLQDGDIVWLGEPGGPLSVMIQFRSFMGEEAVAAASPPPLPAVPPAEWVIEEEASVANVMAEDSLVEEVPDDAPAAAVLAEDAYASQAEIDEADPFADAVLLEEPSPSGAPRPAEEFFLEEPDAGPEPSAPAEPEPLFAEAGFGEPQPAAPEVDEEFFFDAPAAPSPAAAGDAFFIEEPSEPAPAAAAPAANDWTAPAEPLHLPMEAAPPPPRIEAPPPVTSAPPLAPAPPVEATPRPPRPTGARPAAMGARPAVRPAPRPAVASGGGALRWILIAAAALVVLAAGGFFALRQMRAPRIASVEPARVRAGQRIAIRGEHFASDARNNEVSFGGATAGKVVSASPTLIEVEVPVLPVSGEGKVPVVVTSGGKVSPPFDLAVFKAPRVHGISPSVAMPGEEVTLAGTDWGPGALVRFGSLPAAVLDASATSLRVRVPEISDPVGTSLPVVVSMGGDPSNEAPFVIGRVPLVMSVDPAGVSPGEIVTIKGRGFPLQPAASDLKIGGTGALVLSAFDNELKAVVPWAPPGEAPLDLRVPRSEHIGTASMTVAPRPDPLEFRFVAGPIRDDPAHDHAVLATGLGPAFVLSASGGRSAADRAYEAQQRLNEAAVALRASLTAEIEVRDLAGSPALGLTGKAEPLVEITAEDAAAYNEDWTGLRGKGGTVTRARLALWWGAVARDLVLLTIRGERPRFAAELAPEGRVLGLVGDAARKTGKFGLPLEVVEKAPAGWREPLRIVALRVPASVKNPVGVAGDVPAAEAALGGPLRLEGIWSGSETEGGTRKYVTVTFAKEGGGTLTYERALTMSVPLDSVQPQKAAVRFSAKSGSRTSWYVGKWDGLKLRGTIHADSASGVETGTFELERKR